MNHSSMYFSIIFKSQSPTKVNKILTWSNKARFSSLYTFPFILHTPWALYSSYNIHHRIAIVCIVASWKIKTNIKTNLSFRIQFEKLSYTKALEHELIKSYSFGCFFNDWNLLFNLKHALSVCYNWKIISSYSWPDYHHTIYKLTKPNPN